MRKYRIIYADPPWKYNSNQLQKYGSSRFTSLTDEYPCMSTKDIASLDIPAICEDDAALFLWTTDSHLPDALEVIKGWGFTYKTIAFIWQKTIKGTPTSTVGAWTLKDCEICLLATRGRMLKYKKSNKVHQYIIADKSKHSKKPLEAVRRIEEMFGDLPRIELFARDSKPGWDVWGNEIKTKIKLGLTKS